MGGQQAKGETRRGEPKGKGVPEGKHAPTHLLFFLFRAFLFSPLSMEFAEVFQKILSGFSFKARHAWL
jgi:hypothetical protein